MSGEAAEGSGHSQQVWQYILECMTSRLVQDIILQQCLCRLTVAVHA